MSCWSANDGCPKSAQPHNSIACSCCQLDAGRLCMHVCSLLQYNYTTTKESTHSCPDFHGNSGSKQFTSTMLDSYKHGTLGCYRNCLAAVAAYRNGCGSGQNPPSVFYNGGTHVHHGGIGSLGVSWWRWGVVTLRGNVGVAHHHVIPCCRAPHHITSADSAPAKV